MSIQISKDPIEVIRRRLNFTDLLPDGETLQPSSSVSILKIDGQEDTTLDMLVSTSINPSNIVVVIKNGIDRKKYKVIFLAVTQNLTFKEVVILSVREE
jgi:hypothetical protein